jgi:hypothetical protein
MATMYTPTALDNETLDDLLCRWHQWPGNRAGACRGWPSRALVCGESVTSRQYDDVNGALDLAVDACVMRDVDFHVGELPDAPLAYRSAIHAQARALVTGAAVWSSPRLPRDTMGRSVVTAHARCMLIQRLQSAGVM